MVSWSVAVLFTVRYLYVCFKNSIFFFPNDTFCQLRISFSSLLYFYMVQYSGVLILVGVCVSYVRWTVVARNLLYVRRSIPLLLILLLRIYEVRRWDARSNTFFFLLFFCQLRLCTLERVRTGTGKGTRNLSTYVFILEKIYVFFRWNYG